MENNEVEQVIEAQKTEIIRRELLPWWMKAFCWLFMVMGGLAIPCLIFGLFGGTADLSLYGFSTNNPISVIGLFLIAIMVFKGFTAYSLWYEKDYALLLGKIDAISGVLICIFSMFAAPFLLQNYVFTGRLEIILLVVYYIRLTKIEYEWTYLEKQ